MWSNYIKIALRGFRRQSLFSGINVVGLAIGLAACWMIGLYIRHERRYDHHLPFAERICMAGLDLKMGEQEALTTNTPPPLAERLSADFPEVELCARSFGLGSALVRRDWPGHAPLVQNETGAMAVDTAYLELFGFPMLQGDPATALDQPGSVVLTEKTAQMYFGTSSPMGQALFINDQPFTVRGIVQDLPSTSTVQFSILASMSNFRVVERFSWSWIWLQVETWVRFREKTDPARLDALKNRLNDLVERYAPAAFERVGQNFADNKKRGDRYAIHLLPLKQLHLGYAGLDSRLSTLGDGQQVRIFGIAGALILVLACVNFMNLTTARSLRRAREVGVRKALGSQRQTLVQQFVLEAMLYSAISMAVAAGLAVLSLPYFNQISGMTWAVPDLFAADLLAFLFVLPVLAGLIGGLYPALYLSRFKTADIFKGPAAMARSSHSRVRSGLVVFQFGVSMVLLLASMVVFEQLDLARHQYNGMQRDNVLVVENMRHFETPSAREAFQQQLAKLPEVQAVCNTAFLPSRGSFGDFYEPEQGDQAQAVPANLPLSSFMTDGWFVPVMGIQMVQGRNFFTAPGLADSTSVILNESAVKAIGWTDPIGKWLKYPGNGNQRFQVVGVMKDFHIASLKSSIEPIALFHQSSKTYRVWAHYMAIRLQPGTEKQAIEKVTGLWAAAIPAVPFEYDFLDASFARLYTSEARTGAVLGVFTGLALLIGCLGLFALAAFTAEQRTKEIGIRKVLGASVASVTGLLARDFLKLVLLAFMLATPVAWYCMRQWLSDFVYRVEMRPFLFIMTGLAALGIAALTVGYHSLRSALANPVDSLKNE
jgi:putative ABC transport system permease protein